MKKKKFTIIATIITLLTCFLLAACNKPEPERLTLTIPVSSDSYSFELSNAVGEGLVYRADKGSYVTLTVIISEGYDGSGMIVKANEDVLSNPKVENNRYAYTVVMSSDINITVSGVTLKA